MENASLSTPISAPQFRGFRRASEISIASQVSGMADSYTASNIANSKCCTPPRLRSQTTLRAEQLLSIRLSGGCFPSITKSLGLLRLRPVLPQSVPCVILSPGRTGDVSDGYAGTTAVLCMLDLAGDKLLKKDNNC